MSLGALRTLRDRILEFPSADRAGLLGCGRRRGGGRRLVLHVELVHRKLALDLFLDVQEPPARLADVSTNFAGDAREILAEAQDRRDGDDQEFAECDVAHDSPSLY